MTFSPSSGGGCVLACLPIGLTPAVVFALGFAFISFPFFILVFVFFNLGFRPGSLVVLRHPRLCRWLRLRGAVCRWPRPWRPPRPTFCLAGFFFFFSFLVIFLCFGSFSLSRPALGVSALACYLFT